jgi:hypothetical protein
MIKAARAAAQSTAASTTEAATGAAAQTTMGGASWVIRWATVHLRFWKTVDFNTVHLTQYPRIAVAIVFFSKNATVLCIWVNMSRAIKIEHLRLLATVKKVNATSPSDER